MRELGEIPVLHSAGLPMELSEKDLREFPDDPTIPHLLLDDSVERQLAREGRVLEKRHERVRRRHLYRAWLEALSARKAEVVAVQLRARHRSFDEICRFEWRVTTGLWKLRLIGWLHFFGVTRRLDREAVETARRLALRQFRITPITPGAY